MKLTRKQRKAEKKRRREIEEFEEQNKLAIREEMVRLLDKHDWAFYSNENGDMVEYRDGVATVLADD